MVTTATATDAMTNRRVSALDAVERITPRRVDNVVSPQQAYEAKTSMRLTKQNPLWVFESST